MRRHLLPAFLMLLASCGDDTVGPGDTYLTSHPQWEWVSACCGIAGHALTPQTEGYLYVLSFDRQGRVRAIRNDMVLVETRYRVSVSRPRQGADQATTIRYDDPLPLGPGIEPAGTHLLVLLEGGGLLLRNRAPCADCFADWTFLPRLTSGLRRP